jgi:hypothetical protein
MLASHASNYWPEAAAAAIHSPLHPPPSLVEKRVGNLLYARCGGLQAMNLSTRL